MKEDRYQVWCEACGYCCENLVTYARACFWLESHPNSCSHAARQDALRVKEVVL